MGFCDAFCLLAGLVAGHRLRPLDPHRACRDAYTTTSPALGGQAGGDREEAVDMDSNASYAGEVERNVSRDNDFSLCGKLYQTCQLVLGQFPAPGSPLGLIEPLS
jgi:hypothetical protein